MSGPDWLILTPTSFEKKLLDRLWPATKRPAIEICGFGAIVPAARTMQLVQQHRPQRILLIGIAGSYRSEILIGHPIQFSHVACYGIGAGTGDAFQTASQMGWSQWPGSSHEPAIAEEVNLSAAGENRLLLTVTAAAANEQDVANRLRLFPNAFAEDMEGFAVAAACQLAMIPLTIVRGVSNQAGDRDKANWQMEAALVSAVELSRAIINGEP